MRCDLPLTHKKAVLITMLLLLINLTSFAQSPANARAREEIWIAPIAEINRYSVSGAAAGGGIAVGYGDGVALGLRMLYCMDLYNVTTLELTAFLRLYFFGGHSGLFTQMNWGPAYFFEKDNDMKWMLSAGLGIGWRFLLSGNWFFEPVVRGGFPYYAGAGVSFGLRF